MMAVIGQIKAKLDLANKVSKHVMLRHEGKVLKGLCPFHDERTPSFWVCPEEQAFHCFGCEAQRDIIDFAACTHGVSRRNAIAQPAQEADVDYQARGERQFPPLCRAGACGTASFAAVLAGDLGAVPCDAYLQQREISKEPVGEPHFSYAPRRRSALGDALARNGLVEAGIGAGLLKPGFDLGERSCAGYWGRLTFPIKAAVRRRARHAEHSLLREQFAAASAASTVINFPDP